MCVVISLIRPSRVFGVHLVSTMPGGMRVGFYNKNESFAGISQ